MNYVCLISSSFCWSSNSESPSSDYVQLVTYIYGIETSVYYRYAALLHVFDSLLIRDLFDSCRRSRPVAKPVFELVLTLSLIHI